jgi:hypothetical protein
MKVDEAAQVDLGQHVAVEDDDRVAHALRGVADRAAVPSGVGSTT